MPSATQSTTRSVLLALASIAAVLVLGECVVRAVLEAPSAAIPTARLDWEYAPNARIVHSDEGYSVRRTNSLGLLDDEPRVPRPAHRVLLLGDSYAEALQVPKDSAFANVVERLLPDAEVFNAGLSGRTMLDHTEWLEMHGAQVQPDVIVVEISKANFGLLFRPDAQRRFASPPVPGVAEPPPAETGARRVLRKVLHHSALATVSWHRFRRLAEEQGASLSRRLRVGARAPQGALALNTFDDPRLPGMLDALHQRIARHAPRVVYLYIPHLEYFKREVRESDPEVAAMLSELCELRGATFLDAAPAMRAEFRRTGQPVHGFSNSVMGSGHINAAGHRVVGEALAAVLAEDLP